MIAKDLDFIPYALPLIGEEEIAEVVDSLRSGWITTGPKVKRFEEAFGAFVGSPHSVAVNSCTAGLHLSLLAAGIKPGDEVITTPLTFCATVNTILHVGATPVLADVDPVSLNLSVAEVARHITPRTRAVVPVHYAGNPCDMAAFRELADAHGLVLIEDAAHAIGTYHRGRHAGTFGDFASFSFYATKNLTTAEGGMIACRSEEAAERLRVLALHGMDKDAFKRYTAAGSWFYQVVAPGYKYNMTDLAAGLGLAQLARFEAMQAVRFSHVARYQEAFGAAPFDLPPAPIAEGDAHSWHLYLLRLRENELAIDRDAFAEALKERGIGISVHFIPIHLHPFYQQHLGFREGDHPVAEANYRRMISLPLYPKMTPEQVDRVVETVLDVARHHGR